VTAKDGSDRLPRNVRNDLLLHAVHQPRKQQISRASWRKAEITQIHRRKSGTATRYGLDGPGIESRWRRDFPHLSRPARGTTQPPIPGGGGKAAGRAPRLKKE